MKSFGQLSEDIEERRAAAKQRLKDQESTLKMKGSAVNQAAMERDATNKEKNAALKATKRADNPKSNVLNFIDLSSFYNLLDILKYIFYLL